MSKKNLFESKSGRSVEEIQAGIFGDDSLAATMKVVPAQTTAVAPLDLAGMGFDPAENLKDETPDIPLIKVLPQAQMFAMPDDAKVADVTGVIVETYRCNAWWDPKNKREDLRPSCSSLNDLTPLPDSPDVQSANCATCKHNQFGSGVDQNGAPAGGKACKNMRRMYVLIEGHEFPYLITLSPTSLKSAKKYLTQLSDRGRHIATVVTKVTLAKMAKGSNVFSVAGFATIKDIDDPETLQNILKIKRQLAGMASKQAISGAEYETEDENLDALTQRPGDKF